MVYLAAFGDHAGRKGGAINLAPERGDVVDRDGQPLALTIDAWTIGLQPAQVIGDKLDLAQEAGRADARKGRRDNISPCCARSRKFYYLRRRAAPALVDAINALGEPGMALSREPDRLYPQTALAAHVLGFTDVDGNGSAGIERAFNDRLTDPAQRGTPLTLSISSPIQQALEHELNDAMTHFSAIGAAGVIMNIHTGEVLAMTSLPQLNPNAAGKGSARGALQPRDARRLRARLDLQAVHRGDGDGRGHRSSRWGKCTIARDELHVAGRTINDTHPFGRACSVAEIMKESSNIGTAQIADQIGAGAAEGVPQEDGLPRQGRDRADASAAAR